MARPSPSIAKAHESQHREDAEEDATNNEDSALRNRLHGTRGHAPAR